MKKLITLALALLFNFASVSAHSGDTIVVPSGNPATIDGIILLGEWDDAYEIPFLTNGFYSYVYVKHTATHLYVRYFSFYAASCGIYIDKLHNGGSNPKPDDVWIHGSAGPYEFVGTGFLWQQQTSTSNWNFMYDAAYHNSEFQISLSKLGLSAGVNTIGALFSVLDWSVSTADEQTWPLGGYSNCQNPGSWANLIIDVPTSIEDKEAGNGVSIYPNPSNSYTYLKINNPEKEQYTLTVYNTKGQIVKAIEEINDDEIVLDNCNLSKGLYFYSLKSEKGKVWQGKYVIQ